MAQGQIKIVLDGGDTTGKTFKTRVNAFKDKQARAVNAAARRAADEIEYQGRASIASGGNFKSVRWQSGFRAFVSFGRGVSNVTIRVTHAVKYWRVFEFGAKIFGRPLLWIPLSFGNAREGIRARDYPGKLFRVDRPGKAPLLLDKTGPQYFGKESVTIPRKWRLRETVRSVSRKMGMFYREAMKNGR